MNYEMKEAWKLNIEFNRRRLKMNNQPERSKREDCMDDLIRDVLILVCSGCNNEVRYLDKPNIKTVSCKCGALNIVETQ